MSIKSKGRQLGRMVRRITGLHLPIAMKIGKMVAQGCSNNDLIARFPEHVGVQHEEISCPCCGTEVEIVGPKGVISGLFINERTILKEMRINERLAKVPFGTPVSAD